MGRFPKMGISKDRLKPVNTSLVGLVGHKIALLGTIYLTLMLRKELRCISVYANWLVVDCDSVYNAILGRPSLVALRATISPHQFLVKFSTEREVAMVRSHCYKRILHIVVKRVSFYYHKDRCRRRRTKEHKTCTSRDDKGSNSS